MSSFWLRGVLASLGLVIVTGAVAQEGVPIFDPPQTRQFSENDATSAIYIDDGAVAVWLETDGSLNWSDTAGGPTTTVEGSFGFLEGSGGVFYAAGPGEERAFRVDGTEITIPNDLNVTGLSSDGSQLLGIASPEGQGAIGAIFDIESGTLDLLIPTADQGFVPEALVGDLLLGREVTSSIVSFQIGSPILEILVPEQADGFTTFGADETSGFYWNGDVFGRVGSDQTCQADGVTFTSANEIGVAGVSDLGGVVYGASCDLLALFEDSEFSVFATSDGDFLDFTTGSLFGREGSLSDQPVGFVPSDVAPVPLPAPLFFLLSGLGLLGLLRAPRPRFERH